MARLSPDSTESTYFNVSRRADCKVRFDCSLLGDSHAARRSGMSTTTQASCCIRKKRSCAIQIPANKSLELEIEDILFRPPGRPSRKPLVRYLSFRYQAESWAKPRRIVAKVEHQRGELFRRPGFILTNMTLPSRSLVRF